MKLKQIHEILSRWEQHYLIFNPAIYYQRLSCPIGLLFSDSEMEGLLSKRLVVFRNVFKDSKQVYSIQLIRNVDHIITTNQRHKVVSSAFLKALVEQASKSI